MLLESRVYIEGERFRNTKKVSTAGMKQKEGCAFPPRQRNSQEPLQGFYTSFRSNEERAMEESW